MDASPLCSPGVKVMVVTTALLVLAAPRSVAADEPHRITLPRLIELALAGPRAEVARQETAAARARVDEAQSARFPKISVDGFLAPSPEIHCDDADCTRTSPNDFALDFDGAFGGARAQAVQPLFTFGKLSAIADAARAAADATGHLEDAVAGDLALEATRAYWGLKLARELVWMLEDGQDEITSALGRIVDRLAEGSPDATVQDKLRIQTLAAEVRIQLAESRQAEAIALAGVRGLAGDDTVDIDDEPLAAVDHALADGGAGAAVAQAQAHRPELRAARDGARAAAEQVDYERAYLFPDLALLGSVSFARAQGVDDPPGAFADDPFNTTSAGLALVLRWQIEPMTTRARIARARARRHQADAVVELASAYATFEARSAVAEATEAKARVTAATEGEASARAWVASVLQGDAIGTSDAKDLADAYLAYFQMRARLVNSIFQWNLATVRLQRALGEFAAPGSSH